MPAEQNSQGNQGIPLFMTNKHLQKRKKTVFTQFQIMTSIKIVIYWSNLGDVDYSTVLTKCTLIIDFVHYCYCNVYFLDFPGGAGVWHTVA